MKRGWLPLLLLPLAALAADRPPALPAFPLQPNDLALERLAQPGMPFDKVGRRFAILGTEEGRFEAWAWPLKLLRNFEFSFLLPSSSRPLPARDIVRRIAVTPEATVISWSFQSFTARAIFITPFDEAGAVVLLDIDSDGPLAVVCSFLPVLQPMWPAGLGGQYAYWDDDLKAYVMSESSRRHHALVGSPLAAGISYTPAHMLADSGSEFRIEIADAAALRDRYIPIVLAGGAGRREDVVALYRRLAADPQALYRRNVEHYRRVRDRSLQVRTPDRELDLALEWAKVTYDNLLAQNPDLGTGLIAGLGASGTSGRPGFGWFFGGDAYINSFALNALGDRETARAALAFTRRWQRGDGKMAHELTQAARYVDWFKEYGYAYIHGDTTPFYIAAVRDHWRRFGDDAFLRESWPSLRRAWRWCLATDANGDGLMDNGRAGLGAMEYGDLTGIASDVYLAAVWLQAARSMAEMADAAGDRALARQARQTAQAACRSFEANFWDEQSGGYAFAFNGRGERVHEVSPTSALALMWGYGTPEHARRSLQALCGADLMTDWGVRSLSRHSRYYKPLDYNYGAVWPFNAAWLGTALFRHGLSMPAWHLLRATARHTFDNLLGGVAELFSGARNASPQEAVAHQGFSSTGVALPFVCGLLGLDIDAPGRRLTLAPQWPADWPEVSIGNIALGTALFDLRVSRRPGSIRLLLRHRGGAGVRLRFCPVLEAGARLTAVRVDGRPAVVASPAAAALETDIGTGDKTIDIEFRPGLELLPLPLDSRPGDVDRGLKVIAVRESAAGVEIALEGLAGAVYRLPLHNPGIVAAVSGAELEQSGLRIDMPATGAGFMAHTVTVELKSERH